MEQGSTQHSSAIIQQFWSIKTAFPFRSMLQLKPIHWGSWALNNKSKKHKGDLIMSPNLQQFLMASGMGKTCQRKQFFLFTENLLSAFENFYCTSIPLNSPFELKCLAFQEVNN